MDYRRIVNQTVVGVTLAVLAVAPAHGEPCEEHKLLPSDGAADDRFGGPVSVSGDVAVVGAYRDDDNGTGSGSAYVFRWDGSSFSLVFDGSAQGIDSALDIDAAQDLGGGSFLMSFDTTGQIDSVVFQDEDVVRFDGSTWSLEYDASAADSNWAAADLDAVTVPEPSAGMLLPIAALGLAGLASLRGGA